MLLALLAGAGATLCAQTAAPSPLRQQAIDREFLRHRGFWPPPAAPVQAGTSAPNASQTAPATATIAGRLAAVRARQSAIRAASPLPGRALPDGAGGVQPALGSSATVWQAAGPIQLSTPSYGLVTGRVSSLAADPTNSSILYLGATGGGVWKSTNATGNAGGVTFRPLTDDITVFANSQVSVPSLSIGALSVQPSNPNVVLAGTGDPNDALDSYYGVGILRSTDGGTTWNLYQHSNDLNYHSSFVGEGFAGFAWSTTAPNLVVAAVSQSLEGQSVGDGDIGTAGLYYSKDAGITWYLSTITDGSGQVVQSSGSGGGPPGIAATSVVWNATRKLFLTAVRFHGYYSSPDGITWTRLSNQPGPNLTAQACPAAYASSGCPIFRGVLAVQPVTGDTFALTTDLNNVDGGLYQDVCSTSGLAVSSCASGTVAFGTQISDTALDDATGAIPQADYNLALAAVPSQQDTLLFAGTEDVFRCSLANSCQWRNTTNVQTCASAQVAPSTHAIEGSHGANGLLFFGNDGGLWRTTDGLAQTGPVCAASDGSHFDNLNGGIGSLAEISHLAVSPSNGSLVLAGMGQFGIVASENAAAQGGTGAWQQLLTGEGSLVAIDPLTPGNWYADAGAGLAIFPCANGGNCNAAGFGTSPSIGRSQVADDTDDIVTNGYDPAPWILDPGNPANILVGTCRMWLGPATGGWTGSNLLSGMLDGNAEPFCNGNGLLRSVGAGGSYNAGGEQMYAGMAGRADGGRSVPGHLYGATVPQSGGKLAWTDLWRNPVTNTPFAKQFNPSGYAISSLAVDPHDTTGRTVYAGIAGFPTTEAVLYGSTDGGAHWANLTNSLPFAPVNSVVVDPNNGGYVYVAGDFGVYVATDITKCYGTGQNFQNCWTELGSGLPNAPVTDLKVYSSGTTTMLEAATYGRGIWTLGLTTNPLTPQAALSPASYSFPAGAVGSPDPAVPFTLSNTGSVALAIAQIAAAPATDYTQTNNCGASLAAGASCTIQVVFNPGGTGDRTGSLTVRANTQGGTLSSALDGTGLKPGALSVSPSPLAFPTTTTGTNAATLNLTLANNPGGAPLTLGGRTLSGTNSGDFTLPTGSTCGSTLAAGASCTVPVGFNPTGSSGGTRTAQLAIVSSDPASPAVVSLSGNAVTPASLSVTPGSLAFPGTTVGTASAAQPLTVSNSGGTPAQLGTPAMSTSDYSFTTNCGATLAPNGSCSIQVTFTPTAGGTRAGLLTLPSPGTAGSPFTVGLSGAGLKAAKLTLSPGSLTFADQTLGSTSAAQTVNVTNAPDGSAAQLGTPTATGDYTVAGNGCPLSLPASQSCTLSVTFTPTLAGTRTGVLSIPYSGSPPSTASLSGTGVAPGALFFNPSPVNFPTTADNATSATIAVTVTNNGGSPAAINSVAASGPFAVAGNNCPVAPATLAVNGTCTLNVTFTPPGAGSYTGSATLSGTFGNSPASVPLSGQGAAPPAATLTPGSLSFPDTVQGSASAPQSLTVTSTGGVAVTLGAPSVSTAEYQVSGNSCPPSLAPNATCTIAVLFHPNSTGPRPAATLSLPGNMAGGAVTAGLNGYGLPPGALKLTPSSIQFGPQFTGTASAAQSVTVSNTGGAPVTLGTPSTTGDYAVAGSCPESLPPGQACTLFVTFAPTITGDRPGQLIVPRDSGNSSVTTLDGTGTTPGQLVFSPTSLTFNATATGSSATSSVTVFNNGGTAVQFSAITVTGDFAVAPGGSCTPSTLLAAAGGSCTLNVTFAPTAISNHTGDLTIANNGSPPSVREPLSGTGVRPGNVAFSPASVDFGPVVLNGSASQAFTARNSGDVAVSLGTPLVSGTGYRLDGNGCGAPLSAGSTCTVQVIFSPTNTGESPGTLTLPWGSGSSATAVLDGTGVTPGMLQFNPDPVAFGATVVRTTATQSVMVQNIGGVAVPLGFATASGGFAVTNPCPGQLAPGASCLLQISFTPLTAVAVSGLLTVTSAGGGSSWSDPLSGTGVQPGSLAAQSSSLTYGATVTGTASVPQTATFRNPGGAAVALNPPQLSSADYTITMNGCGTTLGAGQSCNVGVAFTPGAAGDRPATLTLASSASGGPSATVALDGTGLRPAFLAFSPPSLAFGGVFERSVPPVQTLTLLNSGDVPTGLGSATLFGQYTVSSNSCVGSLGAGKTCQIGIKFQPVTTGAQPGSLSIASATGTPSATASLSGTGLALELSPATVAFTPSLAIGTASAPVAIAIENLGTTPITLQLTLAGSDFSLGNPSCGPPTAMTLQPDSSCAVFVTFTPSASGLRAGTLVVSGGGETQTAQLSGNGLSPATDTLSPATLVFPVTVAGKASAPQAVTLTNSGDATLERIATAVTGNFVVINNCGDSLGGHQSCSIAVSFVPSDIGQVSGTLSIADAQRTQSVSLSGQGAPPPQASALPLSLNFGPYAIGMAAPAQTVTISNLGKTPLDHLAFTTTEADFTIGPPAGSFPCGSSLAAGASCQLAVAFTPGAIGGRQATLSINSPALASPLVVGLTGSGEDYQLSPYGSTTVVLTSGQTATYRFALTPTADSAGSIQLSCSGAPLHSVCTVNPTTVQVGQGVSGSIQLTVATGTTQASVEVSPFRRWWPAGSMLALLCPVFLRRGEARRRLLVLLVAAALVIAPLGCGVHASGVNSASNGSGTGGGTSGSSGSGSGSGLTPRGTYTLTLTASYPGTQRTTTVTLIVE